MQYSMSLNSVKFQIADCKNTYENKWLCGFMVGFFVSGECITQDCKFWVCFFNKKENAILLLLKAL